MLEHRLRIPLSKPAPRRRIAPGVIPAKSSHATEIAELKRAVEVLLARTSPEGRIASK